MGNADRSDAEKHQNKAHSIKKDASTGGRTAIRQSGDDDFIRTLDHKRRREIMRLLHASEVPLSIHAISEKLDATPGRTGHHMQLLRRRGLTELVAGNENADTFYVSRIRDQAAVTIFLDEEDRLA